MRLPFDDEECDHPTIIGHLGGPNECRECGHIFPRIERWPTPEDLDG